ncbi:Tetratricopeptide repeat-containing protein [Reichenbachiella agariperforans]|uniref:Tetratricopeptide repeat-containing protein n=1 Tax=Reichenbachiella agariperforans TaxID=156994 RepID=A0A1M6JTJ0_REIAG|nr:tetratricopeptide repeat protein [Reichenbachiella agariperforans]SHJ50008.1 Tetratricopeptide repeat-containing protein [Reichenbachiella agariperforans]
MKQLRPFIILTFVIITTIWPAQAQSDYEKAERYFADRGDSAQGLVARKRMINRAIKYYKRADQTPETVAALLRAYEFKGSFTRLSEKKKLETYKVAVDLGREYIHRYASDVGVKYYYMTNLGRWGNTVGVMTAAQEGVSDEIKALAEEVIEMDDQFAESGAQRILGIMHLKLPQIPFVLSWPSEDEALRLLETAYSQSPQDPANARFFAEALIAHDQKDKAQEVLRMALKIEPRTSKLIEDRNNLDAIEKMLSQNI